MAGDHHVHFTPRAEATVLPGPDEEQRAALMAAGQDRASLRDCAARWPALLEAWAGLAEAAKDPVDSYAYARVGYHRGLDALRRAGWQGSGEVPASHESNLGFLRCLYALRRAASALGESDEVARCEQFLHQLDPSWRGQLGGQRN